MNIPDTLLNDFAIIIFSCLDNALEATAKISDKEKRWIKVIMKNDSTYIYLQIENNTAEDVFLPQYEIPKATKKDSYLHGLSLKNVKKLVKFHQGELVLNCVESVFFVGLMVNYQNNRNETANSA